MGDLYGLIWPLSHVTEQRPFQAQMFLEHTLTPSVAPLRWGVPVGLKFCEGEWTPFTFVLGLDST